MKKNIQAGKLEVKKFLPGIAWFFILLILICLPGKDIPHTAWLDGLSFDKFVHCFLFGMLVALFCFPFKTTSLPGAEKARWFLKITLSTVVWGITTELIQKYFVVGRQFDWFDWLADSIGAFVAFYFCRKYFL